MPVENAIVLAGGKGTRLRPLTLDIPKPLIRINRKPLIEYMVEELERNGVKKIYLSIGYKAEKIIRYFDHRRRFGAEIEYVLESKPLGTGGAVRFALNKIQGYEDVVVTTSDTIISFDLQGMYKVHKEENALITLGSIEVDDIRGFGVIETEGNRIVGFIEKPAEGEIASRRINTGVYIVNKRVLEKMPKLESFSFEKDFIEKICNNENIMHYPVKEFLTVNDINQYRAVKEIMKKKVAGGEI